MGRDYTPPDLLLPVSNDAPSNGVAPAGNATWSMPRARRLNAPGFVFHVTACAQGKAQLFAASLRDDIVSYICDAAIGSTTQLLAFAVMPNHLHLIVRQGRDPLGWMVQRILQRTAMLVRRRCNHKDHVFGKRYWSGICEDPQYLRQIIVYTHLNPCRAGLCKHPDDYPWISHACYTARNLSSSHLTAVRGDYGRRFFAADADDAADARANYDRFVEYWLRRGKLSLSHLCIIPDEDLPFAPHAPMGDSFWMREFGDVVRPPTSYSLMVDVQDRAITALRALAPALSLSDLRCAGQSRPLVAIRRQLMAVLLAGGYRNGAISRCLNVSTSTVSVVAKELRMEMSRENFTGGYI